MNLGKYFSNSNGSTALKFEYFIQVLILISIIDFTLSTLPNLTDNQRTLLDWIDIIVSILFTCEYVLRLKYSKPHIKYALSGWGIIDLFAILPFILGLGIDLRSIRIVRFLKIFGLFKVFRYSNAVDRLSKAFLSIKDELVVFGLLSLILIYVSAVGIYYFENSAQPEKFSSIVDSLWWSIATLTTVGYGDVYPITAGGKLFTFIQLIICLGIVAIPSGLFASALTYSKD